MGFVDLLSIFLFVRFVFFVFFFLRTTLVDIEALKHAPSWGLRHRRDSISGLSTHSQPMIFGGGFGGTQSPAPTYHSGRFHTFLLKQRM